LIDWLKTAQGRPGRAQRSAAAALRIH
jgi:hypothetical protein